MNPSSPKNETILIIEDDTGLLMGLRDNFEDRGYLVYTAGDGEHGLNQALDIRPDLIILDLMLPKINGYEICKALRDEKLEMPIIMLTAKGEESDIVLGLELGADDYLTKPFSIRELIARVEVALRRNRKQQSRHESFGNCRLDLQSRELYKDGKLVSLSPTEYRLLEFFLRNEGRALSRNAILNAGWGYDGGTTDRNIDRFITTLRSKIEDKPRKPQHIKTIREYGYRFER